MQGPFLLALAAAALAAPAGAGTFVFGDSSVEQGNLYARPGLAHPAGPWWAPDGFSRESNGPIWVERLAPGIRPDAGAPPGSRLVNFAYSGATSGSDNIAAPVAGTGFGAQIDRFLARGLKGQAGDLFVVATGTNDFIRDLGQRDLRETSKEMIGNLTAGLARLAAAGAPRILVEDVPAFHLAPAFADIVPPADRPAFDRVLDGFLAQQRADQVAALATLNGKLADADIVTVKVSRLFAHVRANGLALGFTNVSDACYDEATGALCAPDRAGQNRYLFLDGLHLTEAGQKIQADYYAALLGQLDGSAHALPAALAADALRLGDELAAATRMTRLVAWAGPVAPRGLYGAIEGGACGAAGAFAGLGVGWSDGAGWTVRLDARRQTGADGMASGSTLSGWSVVLSGERRIGDFRLGASIGQLSGRVEGDRAMPVALMRSAHETGLDTRFAELAGGIALARGPVELVPAVWLRWAEVRLDGFTEAGDTGLEMAFDDVTSAGLVAGGGVEVRLAVRAPVVPWLGIGWEGSIAGFDTPIRGGLVDNSADPIVRRAGLGGDRGEARGGLDMKLGPRVDLRLSGWGTTDGRAGATALMALRF